ncbi:MAG: hypothetical protein PHI12_09920 [Dehalococcoidales bacterium]|nr:hypothetical protein [Dehalococcoidales bacterium]
MDTIEKLEKLMKFMCDKYEKSDVFRQYGEYPWTLMDESGIDFGDGGAQVAAMDVLRQYGFIEIVGRNRGNKKIGFNTKVRPSIKGMEFVRDKEKSALSQVWPKVVTAIAEGITRGLKG